MLWNNETTFNLFFWNTFDQQYGIGNIYIFDKMISKEKKETFIL